LWIARGHEAQRPWQPHPNVAPSEIERTAEAEQTRWRTDEVRPRRPRHHLFRADVPGVAKRGAAALLARIDERGSDAGRLQPQCGRCTDKSAADHNYRVHRFPIYACSARLSWRRQLMLPSARDNGDRVSEFARGIFSLVRERDRIKNDAALPID